MADVHHLSGVLATARAKAEPIPVQGWDCDDPACCAVMVNPAASNAALADWARAQVEQTCHVLKALNMAGPDDTGSDRRDVFGALQHFQMQAANVLSELSERLQQIELDAAAAQEG